MVTIIDEVDYVASLAKIRLTDEEKAFMAEKIDSILSYFQQIQEIDTHDVPPTTHVLPLENVFRTDEPAPCLDREEALTLAPERDGNYYKVPKIL